MLHATPKKTEPTVPPRPVKNLKRKSETALDKESEETKHLSTSELQRLVLLEQLEVLRLKRQKLEGQVVTPFHYAPNSGDVIQFSNSHNSVSDDLC